MVANFNPFHDAVLRDEIRPAQAYVPAPPKVALVTGASGFLGSYVTLVLLRSTDLRLVVLVRERKAEPALERIRRTLAKLGVGPAEFDARIEVLGGDLIHDHLGLERQQYDALAERVEVIYHCAAAVDWIRDYHRLKPKNVDGVMHVIKLACHMRTKRVVFVSSLAVCYATDCSGPIDEQTDMLPFVLSMPLGYAQTKCVSEALLRQAADHGVPVTIIRPPLIAGHSQTGHSNPTDIIAAILQACITTGLAMDTDWDLDFLPVDYVAKIVACILQGNSRYQVLNLRHQGARAWRGLVLWINLHGYPVRLVSADQWIHQLFEDRNAQGCMIFSQRQFFFGRPARAGETGWIRPFETYLPARQALIRNEKTQALLVQHQMHEPAYGSAVLHRYFEDLRASGSLPARTGQHHRFISMDHVLDGKWSFETSSGDGRTWREATREMIGEATGISSEMAGCRVKDSAGVWLLTKPRDASVVPATPERAVLKVKSHSTFTEEQSIAFAQVSSPELGALFEMFRDALGLENTHERELAMYASADGRLLKFMPKCYGTKEDEIAGRWSMLLEYMPEAEAQANGSWLRADDPQMYAVLDGLAEIHAIWFGRQQELERKSWIARPVTSDRMLQARPLWYELAKYSADQFGHWCGKDIRALQDRNVAELAHWWPEYTRLPSTLIHNDFNPRNILLRTISGSQRLCAYDWELATVGAPQRDLAEILCYTWCEGMTEGHLAALSDYHRQALISASGVGIDAKQWNMGLSLALRHLLLSRLPFYSMIQLHRPLDFLPELMRNWVRLNSLTDRLIRTPALPLVRVRA